MTIDETISRVLDLYGGYKKYPLYFVDYPEVTELLDAASKLARALKHAQNALLAIIETDRAIADTALRVIQKEFGE